MENVCDLTYLSEMMDNKKTLMGGIMDTFLLQIPEELESINAAITKTDYATIRSFAHTMKSSVSIMGITILTPILKEMEDLGKVATGIERIKELSIELDIICAQALTEIKREKYSYT